MADKKDPVWRNPRALARAVEFGLWIELALDGLSLAGAAVNLDFLSDIDAGQDAPADLPPLPIIIDLFDFLAFVVVGVLILMWIYRVCSNARILAHGLDTSPWSGVLWYFVPIAYLWKPFGPLADAWRVAEAPDHWRQADTPPLLRWWWGLWLGRMIIGSVAFRLSRIPGVGGLRASIVGDFISSGFSIACILVFLVVVRRLTAMQISAREHNIFD